MTSSATPGTETTINININITHINAPIDVAWSTLVATDKALPFFFGARCDTRDGLKPGAKMRMVTPNRKVAMVVGEVLVFDPPHVYSHTFQMTNIDEPPATVTYTLSAENGGTRFELMIENTIPGSKLEKEMIGAQKFIAANLKSLVERGKPAFSRRMVSLMGPVISVLAKKQQRIENWPV